MITHNGKQYKVFDTHTHAFPDAIAQGAMELLSEKAGIPYYHDGSHDGLYAYEKRGGSDKFLLLPIATKPSQTKSVNRWAAERAGGRMLSFGSIHPESEHYIEELDEIVDLGLKGIKLHPEYQQFFVDEEAYFPMYEAIFDKGLIICFHAGLDIGFPPPQHGSAQRLASVCDAFPNGRIIAAHMGGYQGAADARKYLAGRENLWMDLAYVADEMDSTEMVSLSRQHGTHRILFATDAPWKGFESMIQSVFKAGFTERELADILYGNAARLLGVEDE